MWQQQAIHIYQWQKQSPVKWKGEQYVCTLRIHSFLFFKFSLYVTTVSLVPFFHVTDSQENYYT